MPIAEIGTSPTALMTTIDNSPELIDHSQHPDVEAIHRSLTAAPNPTP
jgi:hypothetical protein